MFSNQIDKRCHLSISMCLNNDEDEQVFKASKSCCNSLLLRTACSCLSHVLSNDAFFSPLQLWRNIFWWEIGALVIYIKNIFIYQIKLWISFYSTYICQSFSLLLLHFEAHLEFFLTSNYKILNVFSIHVWVSFTIPTLFDILPCHVAQTGLDLWVQPRLNSDCDPSAWVSQVLRIYLHSFTSWV